jgi:methionine-rich copper-binding protein CopC
MSHIRTLSRSLLALGGLVSLMAAMPARESLFHTGLVKSDPAKNDTLATAPKVMRFWFSERVDLTVTTIKVAGAGGAVIALSPLSRPDTGAKAPILTDVVSPVPAGTYTVSWITAGHDGHPVKGKYDFVVKAK